jgi:hypothetical protein
VDVWKACFPKVTFTFVAVAVLSPLHACDIDRSFRHLPTGTGSKLWHSGTARWMSDIFAVRCGQVRWRPLYNEPRRDIRGRCCLLFRRRPETAFVGGFGLSLVSEAVSIMHKVGSGVDCSRGAAMQHRVIQTPTLRSRPRKQQMEKQQENAY